MLVFHSPFPVFGRKVFRVLRVAQFVFTVLLLGSSISSVCAQTDEGTGLRLAEELRVLVTEGTSVINDLQPMINSGKPAKDKVSPAALVEQFKARYRTATSRAFDVTTSDVIGETRRAYLQAYTNVVTRFQLNLTVGGPDVFVPAYFRAQSLKEFNKLMQGKLWAYATNRDNELINSDWAVGNMMKNSPIASEVTRMMASGGLDPVVKRTGNTVMGYYPMRLGAACISCHARDGLMQKEGEFGGALVAQIPVK